MCYIWHFRSEFAIIEEISPCRIPLQIPLQSWLLPLFREVELIFWQLLVHQGFFLRMAASHPISFNLGTLQHFPFLRRNFIIQMFNYHSAGKWDLIAIFRIFFAVKKTGKTINSFLVTFLRLPLSCTWIVRILCLNVWKLFFFRKNATTTYQVAKNCFMQRSTVHILTYSISSWVLFKTEELFRICLFTKHFFSQKRSVTEWRNFCRFFVLRILPHSMRGKWCELWK